MDKIKQIKIVTVNDYACAVKLGRCPLFAIEHISKLEDMKAWLHEDFPDYEIVKGGTREKLEAAKRIFMREKMNGR